MTENFLQALIIASKFQTWDILEVYPSLYGIRILAEHDGRQLGWRRIEYRTLPNRVARQCLQLNARKFKKILIKRDGDTELFFHTIDNKRLIPYCDE